MLSVPVVDGRETGRSAPCPLWVGPWDLATLPASWPRCLLSGLSDGTPRGGAHSSEASVSLAGLISSWSFARHSLILLLPSCLFPVKSVCFVQPLWEGEESFSLQPGPSVLSWIFAPALRSRFLLLLWSGSWDILAPSQRACSWGISFVQLPSAGPGQSWLFASSVQCTEHQWCYVVG